MSDLSPVLQWILLVLALLGPVGFVVGMAALYMTRRSDVQERDEKLYAALERTDATLVQVYQTLQGVHRVLSDILQERREFHGDLMDHYRQLHVQDLELEALRRRVSETTGQDLEDLPTTPLLLICGDEAFCREDFSEINRAGVWARPLEKATKVSIEDELQRRRQNDDLYPWVVISAHGSPQGILLSDGLADRTFWNRQLEGVQVVFLANCEGPQTGDVLAGVVPYVVLFYGERRSKEIGAFLYAFWREMMQTRNPDRAYRQALLEVPTVRPYTDLRRR